jgi:hypothetical protein
MTELDLLPEFEKAIAEVSDLKPWSLPIRPNAVCLSEQVQLIETVDQGEALLAQLNRLPVGAIAIDTELPVHQRASQPRSRSLLARSDDARTANPQRCRMAAGQRCCDHVRFPSSSSRAFAGHRPLAEAANDICGTPPAKAVFHPSV